MFFKDQATGEPIQGVIVSEGTYAPEENRKSYMSDKDGKILIPSFLGRHMFSKPQPLDFILQHPFYVTNSTRIHSLEGKLYSFWMQPLEQKYEDVTCRTNGEFRWDCGGKDINIQEDLSSRKAYFDIPWKNVVGFDEKLFPSFDQYYMHREEILSRVFKHETERPSTLNRPYSDYGWETNQHPLEKKPFFLSYSRDFPKIRYNSDFVAPKTNWPGWGWKKEGDFYYCQGRDGGILQSLRESPERKFSNNIRIRAQGDYLIHFLPDGKICSGILTAYDSTCQKIWRETEVPDLKGFLTSEEGDVLYIVLEGGSCENWETPDLYRYLIFRNKEGKETYRRGPFKIIKDTVLTRTGQFGFAVVWEGVGKRDGFLLINFKTGRDQFIPREDPDLERFNLKQGSPYVFPFIAFSDEGIFRFTVLKQKKESPKINDDYDEIELKVVSMAE